MDKRYLLCAALATFGALSLAQSPFTLSAEQATLAAHASFPEYLEFLSLPNDAVVAADVLKNAQWLEAAFRKRGFTTRLLPNAGKPLVYAELANQPAQAKTVLFYMHFDGQPVVPEQWAQKSHGSPS